MRTTGLGILAAASRLRGSREAKFQNWSNTTASTRKLPPSCAGAAETVASASAPGLSVATTIAFTIPPWPGAAQANRCIPRREVVCLSARGRQQSTQGHGAVDRTHAVRARPTSCFGRWEAASNRGVRCKPEPPRPRPRPERLHSADTLNGGRQLRTATALAAAAPEPGSRAGRRRHGGGGGGGGGDDDDGGEDDGGGR
eukprot:scaffold624_cov402-Prasinococcus_capsulatus_cf.AAC.4